MLETHSHGSGAQKSHVCRLQPEAQDAGGVVQAEAEGSRTGSSMSGQERSALPLPLRAPSVWMRPLTLGTVVRAAPPSASNAHLFQKHPHGPTQESRLPVPCSPSAPSGGRIKSTTTHADVAREENVGVGF